MWRLPQRGAEERSYGSGLGLWSRRGDDRSAWSDECGRNRRKYVSEHGVHWGWYRRRQRTLGESEEGSKWIQCQCANLERTGVCTRIQGVPDGRQLDTIAACRWQW